MPKRQFKNRTVSKEYTALVHGQVAKDRVINSPLARSSSGKMAASRTGRAALTEIKIVRKFSNTTLLRVGIKTGRTHQIKVHLLSIGHPIVGERLYIGKKYKLSKYGQLLTRPFLHASRLSFLDLANRLVTYNSKLPDKLSQILNALTPHQ